jgi:hypothetical protein
MFTETSIILGMFLRMRAGLVWNWTGSFGHRLDTTWYASPRQLCHGMKTPSWLLSVRGIFLWNANRPTSKSASKAVGCLQPVPCYFGLKTVADGRVEWRAILGLLLSHTLDVALDLEPSR